MLATSPELRLGLLGPLRLTLDGNVTPVPAPKHRAVLAILAINMGRPIPAERIIEELWQGAQPAFARKTLQGYVWRIRHLVGGHLVTRGSGYELRAVPGETDATCFEGLVAEGRRASRMGEHARARGRLASALRLWRGPALADVPASPMILAHAGRLEETRLLALEAEAEADLALGRQAEVVPRLRELIIAHPLRESLHALLMLSLYRCSRQSEALAVYSSLRETLIREQGLQPGRAVSELHRRILQADPELDR
ncbi:AfsR/SARP family transcriptional regulator [Microtetraspora sp. AC03309]|uniref:AfsR/SARP family transcriptional regulator n=1 Tax=Microtetraspora sp. AC03309 TaxID=2779376 RepID=UPI001E301627|nr:AfsR/SARP family transcriptional regulator [Microtetraspora sp. AC03309]MCC5575798.1 AfsR/SARP family transcriptional regulator [Microtetraspora sp. AC03309]